MLTSHETHDVDGFVRRVLTDTGFCCRNLLGWNFDEEGEHRVNVGTGGVRSSGAHQQIVDMLDDKSTHYKLIEAPRGSYKSTILQGLVIRNILLDPDIRVFYVSKTDKIALEKSVAIRNALTSELVTHFFGEQKGYPWEDDRFTVRGRKSTQLMSPTFSIFSMETMPTGGRANLIVIDDPIDQDAVTNPDMIEKTRRKYAMLHPFLAKGGTMVLCGTRYGHMDLFGDAEQSPLFQPPDGASIILGAGVQVTRNKDGALDLIELPSGLTFPHMTMDFLRKKLHGMSRRGEFYEFSCQYLNEVPVGANRLFRRHFFQPLRWGQDMEALTGYLLTDTAVSQKDSGCHSVVAYVGLDASDNIYLLDLRVGHWQPAEFVNVFFDVLETWQARVNHCGECWENIALSTVFNHSIRADSRSRKIRTHTIEIQRYSSERKHMRIQRLHAPMTDKKFWVVDTVPKTYEDLDGTNQLWDPEGHFDSRLKVRMPGGELVDQFVNFPSHPKNDIADTIGMVLESEKRNGNLKRYCQYRPYRPKLKAPDLTKVRDEGYRRREHEPVAQDWWSTVTSDLYRR